MGAWLRKIGAWLGSAVVILVAALLWINHFIGPWLVQRAPQDDEYSAQEVAALDGWISCMSYRDWYITAISGPCGSFQPPAKVAIGEHFTVGGTDYEIKIILATHIDKDFDAFKKGDWYCEASESERDLDHGGRQWRRTWLFIPKCQPVR